MSLTQDAEKLLGKKAHPLEVNYPEVSGALAKLEKVLQLLNAAIEDERQAIEFYTRLYMMPEFRENKLFFNSISSILAQEREHIQQLHKLYENGRRRYRGLEEQLERS